MDVTGVVLIAMAVNGPHVKEPQTPCTGAKESGRGTPSAICTRSRPSSPQRVPEHAEPA